MKHTKILKMVRKNKDSVLMYELLHESNIHVWSELYVEGNWDLTQEIVYDKVIKVLNANKGRINIVDGIIVVTEPNNIRGIYSIWKIGFDDDKYDKSL